MSNTASSDQVHWIRAVGGSGLLPPQSATIYVANNPIGPFTVKRLVIAPLVAIALDFAFGAAIAAPFVAYHWPEWIVIIPEVALMGLILLGLCKAQTILLARHFRWAQWVLPLSFALLACVLLIALGNLAGLYDEYVAYGAWWTFVLLEVLLGPLLWAGSGFLSWLLREMS